AVTIGWAATFCAAGDNLFARSGSATWVAAAAAAEVSSFRASNSNMAQRTLQLGINATTRNTSPGARPLVWDVAGKFQERLRTTVKNWWFLNHQGGRAPPDRRR